MDTVSDLRAFVRVIDRGSFSSAANDLGITPSAVSKLVSRLEDRLGVRLLERSTRRLALTPEGQLFVRNICMVFDRYLESDGRENVYSKTI